MTIEWFRDLVIIMFGLIAIGSTIFFMVIAYLLYKRISRVLDSLEESSEALQTVCSYVTEPMSQPLSLITSLFHDVRQGLDSIGKIFQGGNQE